MEWLVNGCAIALLAMEGYVFVKILAYLYSLVRWRNRRRREREVAITLSRAIASYEANRWEDPKW